MLENLELSLENFTSWFHEASKQTMAATQVFTLFKLYDAQKSKVFLNELMLKASPVFFLQDFPNTCFSTVTFKSWVNQQENS